MGAQSTKNYPTTKLESGYLAALSDAALRASADTKAKLVEILVAGNNPDPFQARLLRFAGDLGLPLSSALQGIYKPMKAKSAEHRKAVADGVNKYRAAKAQAAQPASQQSKPEQSEPAVSPADSSDPAEQRPTVKAPHVMPLESAYRVGSSGFVGSRAAPSSPASPHSPTPHPLTPEAQAELAALQHSEAPQRESAVPTADTLVPQVDIMQQLAAFALPEPAYEAGSRRFVDPSASPTRPSSGVPQFAKPSEQPHPLRPAPPKPNS